MEPFDYVILNSKTSNEPPYIAQVSYIWEDSANSPFFHAHLFCRGSDTILGETSDPRELFLVDVCENCPLGSIVRKAHVEFRKVDKNWAQNGGLDRLSPHLEDDGKTFFYSKRYEYEFSRFVDVVKMEADKSVPYTPCDACRLVNLYFDCTELQNIVLELKLSQRNLPHRPFKKDAFIGRNRLTKWEMACI